MQNFCNLVEGNMFKFGVEQRGVGKMSAFQRKSCHISEMVRDTAEVTIRYPLSSLFSHSCQ